MSVMGRLASVTRCSVVPQVARVVAGICPTISTTAREGIDLLLALARGTSVPSRLAQHHTPCSGTHLSDTPRGTGCERSKEAQFLLLISNLASQSYLGVTAFGQYLGVLGPTRD